MLGRARTAALVLIVATYGAGCASTPSQAIPSCDPNQGGDALILMAQAVPSATQAPCIEKFPVGWTFGGEVFENGRGEFWLDSDRAGDRAVTVVLERTCDVGRAVEVRGEADEVGLRRFEEPRSLSPAFSGRRYYRFPGGCVTYRFSFPGEGSFVLAAEVTEALGFISRREGVEALAREGLILCGAGVRCPG